MSAGEKSIAALLLKKCLLGVVHLSALPGAPSYRGKLDLIRQSMRRDLLALKKGGAHAVIIENFGDAPFAADSAGPAAVACLTSLACEARELFPAPSASTSSATTGSAPWPWPPPLGPTSSA
jgi:predicted TIM-barrel enzyme